MFSLRSPFFYLIFYSAISFLLFACSTPQEQSISAQNSTPNDFAVASAHPLATQAGINILLQGGNAFDAAVAVTAVLAVVEPYASGLGGGGFWLLHVAESDQNVMIDGREVQYGTSISWLFERTRSREEKDVHHPPSIDFLFASSRLRVRR